MAKNIGKKIRTLIISMVHEAIESGQPVTIDMIAKKLYLSGCIQPEHYQKLVSDHNVRFRLELEINHKK